MFLQTEQALKAEDDARAAAALAADQAAPNDAPPVTQGMPNTGNATS